MDQRLAQLEQALQKEHEQNQVLAQELRNKEAFAASASQAAGAAEPPSDSSSAPGAAAGPHPAPVSDAEEPKLTHGWIARIMPVGADVRVVPADELGHFVATKDSYKLRDFAKESGIRSGTDVGWKGDAFLEVTKRGRHTISINFTEDNDVFLSTRYFPSCAAAVALEGQKIAQGVVFELAKDTMQSVVGGANLEPGRYRMEFWVSCGVRDGDTIKPPINGDRSAGVEYAGSMNVLFEVLVKRPEDSAPVSAAKALVIKLQR